VSSGKRSLKVSRAGFLASWSRVFFNAPEGSDTLFPLNKGGKGVVIEGM
jgi:hypothetical protein